MNYLAQMFYSTLGEVQLRGHHAAEAEQALRPALRLAEQNLASLNSEKSRTSWSKDAAPVYLGLAEAELVQGATQESLEVYEWYLGAPQRRRQRSWRSQSAARSDPWLPARLPLLSNETVLAYAALPDGLAIWVYDDRGVQRKWIPKSPPRNCKNLAARFHDLVLRSQVRAQRLAPGRSQPLRGADRSGGTAPRAGTNAGDRGGRMAGPRALRSAA